MDKNVGSVNLDELKAAREALDRERGIETDPNMYNDYDPEKHKAEKEQEKLARQNSSDDAEGDVSADKNASDSFEESSNSIINAFEDENTSESANNFDVYDNFSDFEVNTESAEETLVANDMKKEEASVAKQSENDDEDASLDNFLDELDSILLKNKDDEEISNSNEEIEKSTDEVNVNNEDFSEIDGLEKFSIKDNGETKSNLSNENLSEAEILTDFSKLSEMAEEINTESSTTKNKSIEADEEDSLASGDHKLEDNSEDDDANAYKNINKFNFIDIISSEEFKAEDSLSYVLGKDEENQTFYSNLRDTCGTAIFTKNEEVVFDQFGSILLSLLLKNTPEDIQFVICDAMYDSDFDVFNESSYMYLSRVAKNNREIVDSLIELSKELENRYNNLVYAGVKSISAYNMQADERGISKMPYIVLFMSNYAKMTQFLDADKINVCLHNILKFGRIVGVYAIVASASEIERNDINYNLPTRIAYKVDDAHESVSAIGKEGAENLKDINDFLYSTVYDEEIRHLKVPNLTKKEIELIIQNLEN